jgi:hypothetical protein
MLRHSANPRITIPSPPVIDSTPFVVIDMEIIFGRLRSAHSHSHSDPESTISICAPKQTALHLTNVQSATAKQSLVVLACILS